MNQALVIALSLLLMVGSASAEQVSSKKESAPAEAINSGADQAEVNDAETRTEAATRFQRGLEFYDVGDYALALIEFDRAYQLVPDYRVLYNVGQVSIQLSRFARARTALARYLEEGADALSEERIRSVQNDLEMLKARTARLLVTTQEEEAEVLIDDVPVGLTPLEAPLLLDAGEHRVVVRKHGFVSKTAHLTLAGADNQTLNVKLDRVRANVQLVAQPAESPAQNKANAPVESQKQPQESRRVNPWLVVGWSTTAVLATGAVVTGILGLGSASKARKIEEAPDPSQKDYEQHVDTSQTRFIVADILAGGALITGGVTLYFQVRPAESPDAPPLLVGLGANRVSLSGSF